MELVATSSSSIGAMPVHSESQKPITNSSSATPSSSSASASSPAGPRSDGGRVVIGGDSPIPQSSGGPRLGGLQLVLDDVPARLLVGPIELRLEQVRVATLGDRLAAPVP